MIKEGKIKEDEEEEKKQSEVNVLINDQEHMEFEVLMEMVKKYYRSIEFFGEQKNEAQVAIAKKEL